MRIVDEENRRWLVAEDKKDTVFVESIYRHGKGWAAYSSDGYGPFGAIAFDFGPKGELMYGSRSHKKKTSPRQEARPVGRSFRQAPREILEP